MADSLYIIFIKYQSSFHICRDTINSNIIMNFTVKKNTYLRQIILFFNNKAFDKEYPSCRNEYYHENIYKSFVTNAIEIL